MLHAANGFRDAVPGPTAIQTLLCDPSLLACLLRFRPGDARDPPALPYRCPFDDIVEPKLP
jgi:hypothetical protein